MIDVATLSVIRRWALREQMSIREISRRTGLARNTVKKYLRAGDEEPRYAKRASTSKLDPYADKLSTWLLIEATKSRKQRRTLLQLHTVQRRPLASSLLRGQAWGHRWTKSPIGQEMPPNGPYRYHLQ